MENKKVNRAMTTEYCICKETNGCHAGEIYLYDQGEYNQRINLSMADLEILYESNDYDELVDIYNKISVKKMYKYCPFCGNKLTAHNNYCLHCFTNLNQLIIK